MATKEADNFSPHLHEISESPAENKEEDKKIRLRAIELYEDGEWVLRKRRRGYEQIAVDYERAFMVQTDREFRSSPDFVKSKKTANVVKKIVERTEFPRWNMKFKSRVNVSEEVQRMELAVLKAAYELQMKKGGLDYALKSKGGAWFGMTLFGDAPISISKRDHPTFPIKFEKLSLDKFYTNFSTATQIRGAASGKNCRQFFVIYDYAYDEFFEEFKDNEIVQEGISWGDLPITPTTFLDLDETPEQKMRSDSKRMGQMALFIDLDMRVVARMAGNKATVFEKFEGDEFPYVDSDGEDYAPFIQLFFRHSVKGWHNFGAGHYMHGSNRVDDITKNKTIRGALKNVDKIDVIDVQAGMEDVVQQSLEDAEKDLADGYWGVMFNPRTASGESAMGKIQPLSGGSMTQDSELINGIVNEDIIESGINLRDVNTDPNKTARAIEQESNSESALIEEISEQNSPEYKFLIEKVGEFMKEFVSEDDDTPLVVSQKVEVDITKNPDFQQLPVESQQRLSGEVETEMEIKNMTMGDAVRILKERGDVEITMEANSGVKSVSGKQVRDLMTAYSLFPSPKTLQKIMAQFDLNFPLGELNLQSQQAQGAEAEAPVQEGAVV